MEGVARRKVAHKDALARGANRLLGNLDTPDQRCPVPFPTSTPAVPYGRYQVYRSHR